ncbi:hypothetical protein PIROE2DRAFT_7737 [Piromyces sp. E2]|nr:hypothetical protein PIROE2DRAFT_7737 [Piromyces sp. E2]|eukprot:OUM65276.1 hypothetical protein PIROE2DRAFT_7737 [Piromyces sp. E2]
MYDTSDVNNIDIYNEIEKAIKENDLNKIKNIIDNEPKYKEFDYNKKLLITAIQNSAKYEIIDYFVNKEDNLNYEIIPGKTPLGEALNKHNFCIADLLLKRNGNINYVNSKNHNILFYLYNSKDEPLNCFTIEYLIKNGIYVNWKRENRTFLDFLIEQKDEKLTEKYLKSIAFNNNFIIKLLSDIKEGKIHTNQEIDTLINVEYEKIEICNEIIDALIKTNNNVFLDLILKYKIRSSSDEILKYMLHCSCKAKNIDFLIKLIEREVDINCQEKNTLLTPLMGLSFIEKKLKMKCLNQRIYNMFELLINAGADINAKDIQGKTALMYILETKKASSKLIKFLIKHGANINGICNDGCSPIVYATKGNNKYVIKCLLDSGVNTNVVSKDGKSLLLHASINGCFHLFKYLIENDLVDNIDCVDQNFETPLMHAVRSKKIDLIEYIVENGADVNCTNINDESALNIACYGRITRKNLLIVQCLIDHGANINKIYNVKKKSTYLRRREYWRVTPLIYAINRQNFKLVKLLVENGADVNGKDINGLTALYYTIFLNKKYINIVEYLLNHGANINEIINNQNETVLFYAVKYSNETIVKLLVDNGADINHKNKDNNIPLGTVTYKNKGANFFEMLINKNVNFEELNKNNGNSIFLNSLSNFNKTLFNYIMDIMDMGDIEIDINHRGFHQNTAMIYAVRTNDIEIVSRVLEKSPDINIKNDKLETPFTLAVEKRNYKIMKLLIENGAEIDNLNVQININMLYNSIYSYRNIRFLIKHGLKINDYIINSKLPNSNYLLSMAVRYRSCSLVEFLLVNGANPYINNFINHIPIQELSYGGWDIENSKKIIEYFVEYGFDINTKNNKGETLLFSIFSHYNSNYKNNLLKYLIENQNADVNTQNNEGVSLLMFSVKNTSKIDFETIIYLVEEKNCSLDILDNNGNTVLMYALNQGNQQVYEYFLDKCHDFTQKNKFGMNLLMSAVKNVNLETVKKLIGNGVPINDVDIEGRNALFYVLNNASYIFDVVKVLALGLSFSNINAIFKYLIENGIDVNCEDSEGKTILFYIVNNLDLMKFAIDHGANVNHLDNKGRTILFYLNNKMLIKHAISVGLDPTIRDKDGHTAIYLKENLPSDLLFYLVEKGADINEYHFSHNNYGFYNSFKVNDLHQAINYNFNFDTPNKLDNEGDYDGNVREVFLDYVIANINYYDSKDFINIIEEAMNKKLFDVNRKNFFGDTPLIFIMRKIKEYNIPMNNLYIELIISMINYGANINEVDREGNSLLYHALNLNMNLTKKIYLRGARFLTRKDQIEVIFNIKNIILHKECSDAIKCEIIKFIQSHQPVDYRKKVDGIYPIFLAIEQNCYMVVKYLLSCKAVLIHTNANKETVMDVAKRIGNQSIINLIAEQKEWIEYSKKKKCNDNKNNVI